MNLIRQNLFLCQSILDVYFAMTQKSMCLALTDCLAVLERELTLVKQDCLYVKGSHLWLRLCIKLCLCRFPICTLELLLCHQYRQASFLNRFRLIRVTDLHKTSFVQCLMLISLFLKGSQRKSMLRSITAPL